MYKEYPTVKPIERYIVKYFGENNTIKTIQVTAKSISLAKKEFEKITKQNGSTIFKIIQFNQ